jgi:nitrogen fixation NifU-like protein
MDSNLRREIIIDNYQNPVNRKKIDDDSFVVASTISDSCIDNITLYVKFKGDVIEDIYFDGEACAITTSATSIMIKKLIGKTIDEAKILMDNYYNMIDEKEYDEELLGELNAYSEIYLQPNRKKCAIFPFETLKKVFDKYQTMV